MGESIVRQKILRLVMVTVIGLSTLFILFILSLTLGPVEMSFSEALTSFINVLKNGGRVSNINELIVYHIRLPRAICVIGVGIGLSIAGAVMQAIIRNPLVDPYITGVSSGAAFGVCLVMFAGITIVKIPFYTIPLAAFLGALLAFLLTMFLAEASGGMTLSYVLAGVIVGIAFSSFTTIFLVLGGEKLHGALFWLFGSFAYVSWKVVWIIFVPSLSLSIIVLLYARELNVILLGDEQAMQSGLDVHSFKRLMIIITSLLTSVCVAFTGIIGFLGLVVPHIARILMGSDHRILLPTVMLVGANVLMIADIIARTVLKPVELPVGAITSLIGVPFFVYLLIKRGREYVV